MTPQSKNNKKYKIKLERGSLLKSKCELKMKPRWHKRTVWQNDKRRGCAKVSNDKYVNTHENSWK